MLYRTVLIVLLASNYGQALNNTAYNIKFPLGYDPQDLSWLRPQDCSKRLSPGEVGVECTLPSGGITLKVSANRVYLGCQDETFNCKELSAVGKHIDAYRENSHVDILSFDNCALPDEELTCVLNLVGARDASILKFKDLRNNVTQRNLVGLKSAIQFQIYGLYNVTKLPYDALSTLPNLQKVMVKDASIQLTNETGNTLSITKMDIIDIKLDQIPGGAFQRTPFLETLTIIGQKTNLEIQEHAFNDLPHLVNLSLSKNNIRSLPLSIFDKNKLLENIDLYGNKLSALHTSIFSGLTRLTEVHMFNSAGDVLHIEDGVFSNLPSLKIVDMHETRLDTVPENLFSNSTNIKEIDMSNCNVSILPEKVFLNLNLERLDLSINEIENLPSKVFYGLNTLIDLNLKQNKIRLLPGDVFQSLTNLKVLNLDRNNIEDLNDKLFDNVSKLEELYLNYNQIRSLRFRTFVSLRHLKVLSVSHNSIVQYSEGITSLLEVSSLDLSYNKIENVNDVWFSLVYLKKLNFSHNYITELARVNFDNATFVDLSHNKITYVDLVLQPNNSPDSLPNLLLDHNPFSCTCSLYNFTTLVHNKYKRIHVNDATCSTPDHLSGYKLTDLSLDMLTCDYQSCPKGCTCMERIAKKHVEFNCQTMPDFNEISRSSPVNTILRLENYTDFNGLPSYVKVLNVSGLNITTFEPVVDSIEIDLTNNALTEAPKVLQHNITVNLLKNPLKCDCEHKDSVTLLKKYSNKIIYYPQLTCDNGDYVETKDINEICSLKSQVTYSLISLIFVCTLGVAAFFAYRYVVIIRILLRKYGFQLYSDLGDYDYDAFVSFAQEDVSIVDEIVKKLESGSQPLKLCVHTRNWIPGEMIVDQIERSVERSRWTIIVLSRNFVKSYWARIEYLTAHSKSKLLILILDDVHLSDSLSPEIKLYIKSTTYTHYSNPYAVERLRDAVLRKPKWQGFKPESNEKKLEKVLDVHINADGQLYNNDLKY